MRKISCILLIGAISLSTIACGNVGNESKNLENVQTTSQQSEEKENTDGNIDVSISGARTVFSDTDTPVNSNPYFDNIPSYVTPELTYFQYPTVDSYTLAQKYLEDIGVSKKGEKLVIVYKDSIQGSLVIIESFMVEGEDLYKQSYYFMSQNQYNDAMERKTDDMFCDESCYYISTEKSKLDPIDGNIGDYESYYASLTDSYRIAE